MSQRYSRPEISIQARGSQNKHMLELNWLTIGDPVHYRLLEDNYSLLNLPSNTIAMP
jgi:hypothetical protein